MEAKGWTSATERELPQVDYGCRNSGPPFDYFLTTVHEKLQALTSTPTARTTTAARERVELALSATLMEPVLLDMGSRRIRVTKPGFSEHSDTLQVQGASELTVAVKLVKRLLELPAVAAEAAERRAPHAIPNYAIRVADDFHRFYHEHRVLESEAESFRLGLVTATQNVIARSLDL